MSENLFNTIYNPDVLSCIANLSNDEVFTPPEVANAMLDMLPQDLFSDPNTKFLDPACKSGVFLREIAKRLMTAQLPGHESRSHEIAQKQRDGTLLTQDDEAFLKQRQEVVNHIFQNQLYGLAITELTSLLSRRSLYCSKYPNSVYSVSKFDDVQGNVRYKNILHHWVNGKCAFCGASKKTSLGQEGRGIDLESHAYEFIHTTKPEEIWKMKFDVIIGNPPYQLETGGGNEDKDFSTQAKPIYHKFIEQAKKLNPRYLCMIVPARWYNGGIGLTQFRNEMINDKRIVKLVDFINSKDCFQGVKIPGGVCYFLWNRDNPSDTCEITNISGQVMTVDNRPLNEFGTLFIRANNSIPIIKKVTKKAKKFLSDTVSALDTFGLPTSEHGHTTYKPGDLVLIHSKGYNTQSKSYIERKRITKNIDLIDKYKVKISRMIPQGGEVGIQPENGYRSISTPHILQRNEVDTFSYLNVGFFDTEEEAINFRDFLCCKFTRYMLRTTFSGLNVSQSNFIFVPQMDMKVKWDDTSLYDYFGLDDAERNLIDSTMRPLDLEDE